ncbi:putative histone-arginine methyltransferase [Chlorella vulgaris]
MAAMNGSLGTVGLCTIQDAPGSAQLTSLEMQAVVSLQGPATSPILIAEGHANAGFVHRLPLQAGQVWQAGTSVLMVRGPAGSADGDAAQPPTFVLRALDAQGVLALQRLHDAAAGSGTAAAAAAVGPQRPQDAQQPPAASQQQLPGGAAGALAVGGHFDSKTDKGSADLYFHYYGCLQHQQNMLQDYIRTGECSTAWLTAVRTRRRAAAVPGNAARCSLLNSCASIAVPSSLLPCLHLSVSLHPSYFPPSCLHTGTYYAAIIENPADFRGKAVMDVGCGSGILSLFAAQAGARVVYAVEASDMAHHARALAAANPGIGDRIKVLHGKVEDVVVPEKVDVLVSEPMGTLLVNERMIESYIYARDKHLKPGGRMFPRLGRLHLCAFSDEALYGEVAQKSAFFDSSDFYGVDLTALRQPATSGYFGQVVVDQIPPNVLVSNCITHTLDFLTATEGQLQDITIPLSLQVAVPCTVHGIASWFDVLFDGSQTQRWLSTAPGLPVTHWFQLRCLLETPLVVAQPGATVRGELRLLAHNRQSYDVHVMLQAPPLTPGGPMQESRGKFDLKEPYYRQQMQWMMQMAAAGGQEGGEAAVAAAAEVPLPAPLVVAQGAPVEQQQQQQGPMEGL